MEFSFTSPRPKELIFQDTKIWLIFTTVAITIILGFNYIVSLQIGILNQEKKLGNIKQTNLTQEIKVIKKNIEEINYQEDFTQNLVSNNLIIKDSIQNLFDLIPEQITLTTIKMDKNKLIIQGITPSKEIYNFLLAIPLKSIFESSTVKFFLSHNGWYKFTSINHFEEVVQWSILENYKERSIYSKISIFLFYLSLLFWPSFFKSSPIKSTPTKKSTYKCKSNGQVWNRPKKSLKGL